MIDFLNRLLRGRQGAADTLPPRRRLNASQQPAAIYAIGDIHGRLDLLLDMERQILADGSGTKGIKWILTLGDHVDRGPQSAEVLTHLIGKPPRGWRRHALLGNHEMEMLSFLARPSSNAPWLGFGGTETLLSYGIPATTIFDHGLGRRQWRELLARSIPEEHMSWLEALPVLIETPGQFFVHAGLVPGRLPGEQDDLDLIGFRDGFTDDFAEFGKTVVHGHQVRKAPLITAGRIAIDTGAYATGVLTAVKLVAGKSPQLMTAVHKPGKQRPVAQ